MNTINIYKYKSYANLKIDEVFLCVFDNNNNLIANYDLATGLYTLVKDGQLTICINDNDLVSGKWVFFATEVKKTNEQISYEKIKINGSKKGKTKKIEYKDEYPWNNETWIPALEYVSRKEREERLSICKSCPFFNLENMTCDIDGKIVLESTKFKYQYCPENKWGNQEETLQYRPEFMPHIQENEANDIIMKNSQKDMEQKQFEDEFEEFLKGL